MSDFGYNYFKFDRFVQIKYLLVLKESKQSCFSYFDYYR